MSKCITESFLGKLLNEEVKEIGFYSIDTVPKSIYSPKQGRYLLQNEYSITGDYILMVWIQSRGSWWYDKGVLTDVFGELIIVEKDIDEEKI